VFRTVDQDTWAEFLSTINTYATESITAAGNFLLCYDSTTKECMGRVEYKIDGTRVYSIKAAQPISTNQ
jgi:hypothetical protein